MIVKGAQYTLTEMVEQKRTWIVQEIRKKGRGYTIVAAQPDFYHVISEFGEPFQSAPITRSFRLADFARMAGVEPRVIGSGCPAITPAVNSCPPVGTDSSTHEVETAE